MKNIFFNSSMPRACSTLLQNILNQNPSIHATPTDGSLELLYGARINYTEGIEFKAQDSQLMEKAWKGFCYGALQGYSEQLSLKPNICIKSRGIGIHYNWYQSFFDRPVKIICMVRNLKNIFASMENMFRSNSTKHQSIQNHVQLQGTTTHKRVEIWANSQPIGLALERLHQMAHDETIKHIHLQRAEDLWSSPKETMQRIYAYLNLPEYQHDFNNVHQITKEDDTIYGVDGLHDIKPIIKPVPDISKQVLGQYTCDWINERFSWFQEAFNYQ